MQKLRDDGMEKDNDIPDLVEVLAVLICWIGMIVFVYLSR